MSLNNDYITTIMVKQHYRELLAEAEAGRLARTVRPNRRGWLQRLFTRPTRPRTAGYPRPSTPAPAPRADREELEPVDRDREPVGACRVNSV